jgi:hypothetical protein
LTTNDQRRGRTPAVVKNGASEGRWIAVAIRERIMHIFATKPCGGPPDGQSHVKGRVYAQRGKLFLAWIEGLLRDFIDSISFQSRPQVFLPSINRVPPNLQLVDALFRLPSLPSDPTLIRSPDVSQRCFPAVLHSARPICSVIGGVSITLLFTLCLVLSVRSYSRLNFLAILSCAGASQTN